MADPGTGARKSRLSEDDRRELVAHALAARLRAYAPYSGYAVGAALRTESGREHAGCNVENASYGLTLCAERVALGSAVAAGDREVTAMAIATSSSPPASPCGACRQVLSELAPGALLLLCNPQGEVEEMTVAAMLPRAFEPAALPTGRKDVGP